MSLRTYSASFLLCLITALTAIAIVPCGQAQAQTVPGTTVSTAERTRMYADLARDVAELEKRLGIVKRVVRLVQPNVVHIEAKKNREYQLRYGSQADVEEAGSGIIVQIKNQMYVLTNRHVVKYANPKDIKIRLSDGRLIHPKKIWEDRKTDVAVMKVQAPQLVPARLGNSDKIEIGDFVLAIGSPFGLRQSVTYGIVSAKGRHDLDLGEGDVEYQNFIQTDAAINPGNSGGPLVNLRGEVVGMNTAIASSSGGNEGIGFSIPIRNVLHIAKPLIQHGKVRRAFLGVSLNSNFAEVAREAEESAIPKGALVTRVTVGSPAEKAGIQRGDVVISYDGIPVADESHLINIVALTEVQRSVDVYLSRNGKVIKKAVRLGDRDNFDSKASRN